jgi:tetratricopeptide (TPR) repeat protein/SAM-dependent methyltransferase
MKGRSGRTGRAPGTRHQFESRNDTRQMLGMAVELHQAGQLGRARALYEQILAREPRNTDALQFLGLLNFDDGDAERARELIEQAIAEKPGVAPYYDNLGKVLESQDRLEEALRAFEHAEELEPGAADRSFNMGVVNRRLGRVQDAERHFCAALDANPDDADYHLNLAGVLKAQARYGEAVTSYRQALSLRPGAAGIVSNLGHAMLLAGDAEGAIRTLAEAIEYFPPDSNLSNSLGNAYRQAGRLDEAIRSYRDAVRLDPASLEARRNLGAALLFVGRADEAVRVYLDARDALRRSQGLRRDFVTAAASLVPETHSPALVQAIEDCLSFADVPPQALAHAAARGICLKYGLDGANAGVIEARLPEMMSDPLLRRLLESTVNVEPALERALTDVRRRLLATHAGTQALSGELLSFVCALGLQCFANEYVFAESGEEAATVGRLAEALQTALEDDASSPQRIVAVLSMTALYRPLHALACADAIARRPAHEWPEPVGLLIERTLLEPRVEVGLSASIARMTAIRDRTSVRVRAQYEENPYPRWLTLPSSRRQSYAAYLGRRFPHFAPPERLGESVHVLVLGCGTGQEAVAAAVGRAVSRVTAVDLSVASLAYGRRMAEKHGVGRIEFAQADALALDQLECRFDVIESVGVLHHLQDPMAGWRAACRCLAPGGVMKIGLYSERARRDVVAARQAIASAGLEPDPVGIRKIRQRILEARAGDPLAGLAGSEDLYTTSACRDLLFHVCEHGFTLPRIRDALEELGLRFIGFDLPSAFIRARYRDFNPGDPAMTDLEAWDRFEARFPETFAAMYVFWCDKPD